MTTNSNPPTARASRNLAFFGPALGGHEGWVTTQGEVLAGLFTRAGHEVHLSSGRIHPVARAAEHLVDLVRWRRHVDAVVVSVFSGRAFALADETITLAGALGIPTVAWLHGGNLPAFGTAHPRWVKRVLGRADAIVSPTGYLARWADTIASGGQVIPNVLELDAYPYRVREQLRPRLLWMRTFQALYDPATAVRTLADLRAGGIDASLTMAGQDKGLLEATMSLASDLGVAPHITFPGFASAELKAKLFADHDIFLNTNVVDNAPVTVLEAAAAGLAVVSTDVGGIPDLLADGVSARLVAPRQPEAMAADVRDLLGDAAAAARLTANARTVAEASDWPAVRERWLALIDSIAVSRR